MERKVIVTVYEGIVTSIHSNDPEVKVIMVDRDNIEAGDESPVSQDVYSELIYNRPVIIRGEFYKKIY